MSSSMALRRSPKPGALTAQTCSVPRSLFTTRVASASPSTSSAMMRSGLPALGDFLEQREQVLQAGDFLLVDEDVGVFEHGFHRLGVGHEVGREIALVELHAFDDFERGLDGLGFLDGDGAVLADLVHRVGDDLADGLVPVGGNGGDLRDLVRSLTFLEIFSSSSTMASTALLMPRWSESGSRRR